MAEIPLSASGKTAMQMAKEAALQAGQLMADRFYESKEITSKGVGDLVTDVDKKAEDMTRAILSREYPDMGFLGEESEGDRADQGYVWIVDPVDGTRNYATGIPMSCYVLGLALDGEVLVGVTYDPLLKEMFHAERGKGAFLNDTPIQVSDKSSLSECIIGMDMSYNSDYTIYGLDIIKSFWPDMRSLRLMGSSALGIAYAAAGRYDLYFHGGLSPWDQVSGMLLVEEAGGMITDRNGQRASLYSDGLVASNSTLVAEFMRKTEDMDWRKPRQMQA